MNYKLIVGLMLAFSGIGLAVPTFIIRQAFLNPHPC